MVNRKLVYLLSFISFFEIACTINNSQKRVITQGDSYYTVSIYKKGVLLTDSTFDKNDYLIKATTYFPEKGNKNIPEKVVYYGQGIEDSIVYDYFLSGQLNKRTRYLGEDRPIEKISYYPTGEISQYLLFDSKENEVYQRDYQEGNENANEKGSPFFSTFIKPAKKYFSENDSVKAMFIAPVPPDCETRFYTLQSGIPYNNIHQIDSTPVFKVEIYPLEKGDYSWKVYMEINEKKSKKQFKSELNTITYSVR